MIWWRLVETQFWLDNVFFNYYQQHYTTKEMFRAQKQLILMYLLNLKITI